MKKEYFLNIIGVNDKKLTPASYWYAGVVAR